MRKLSEKDKELIKEAKKVARKFSKVKWEGQRLSTVGAALRTKDGKIYSGPDICHPQSGSSSICAEFTALSKAYSEGHTEIDSIVAYCYVNEKVKKILSPCGICREFLRLFGNPWIILDTKKKAKLNEIHLFSDNWK